jgi:hypothetical protein
MESLQSTTLNDIKFWVGFRDRYLPPARERIGPTEAEKLEQEGRAMGWQRALSYAFKLADKTALQN